MCGFVKRARESLEKYGQGLAGRPEIDKCEEDEFEPEGSSQIEVISIFTLDWNPLNVDLDALAESTCSIP